MSYQNYDLIMTYDGTVFLYIGGKYYNLSINTGARSTAARTGIRRDHGDHQKIGSLYGVGIEMSKDIIKEGARTWTRNWKDNNGGVAAGRRPTKQEIWNSIKFVGKGRND